MGYRDAAFENPALILCCCGGLPIISLVQGALCVVPVFLIVTLGCVVSSLVLLPKTIVVTYGTLLKSPLVGPNIKGLGFVLLPLPLLLWPVLVLLATTVGSVLYGLFGPLFYLKGSGNVLFDGFGVVGDAFGFVGQFWEGNAQEYDKWLKMRWIDREGDVFDVSLLQMLCGIVLALMATVVVVVCNAVIAVVAYVPCTLRLWEVSISLYFKACGGVWFIALLVFFVVFLGLVPALTALGAVGMILFGFATGAQSGVMFYNRGFQGGCAWVRDMIVERAGKPCFEFASKGMN